LQKNSVRSFLRITPGFIRGKTSEQKGFTPQAFPGMERENSYKVVSPPLSAFFPRINPEVIQGSAPNGALLIIVGHTHFSYSL
jgi:hypothetical protein